MINYNPNSNLVSSTDGGSGASWPGTMETITGCTAGNTLLAVLGFVNTGNTSGTAPPSAPAGWVLDSNVDTGGNPSALIGFGIYRKSAAASGSNAFAPSAPASTGPYYWTLALFEVTPLALDKSPAGVIAAAVTLTGPNTGTLSAAIEFAVAGCAADNTSSLDIPSLPTGFTTAYSANTSLGFQSCYQITSATTALNPSWSCANAFSMAAGIVTYTDASGSAPVQPKLPLLGVGAIAPFAWAIRRRQKLARERNAELRRWKRDDTSGLILPDHKIAA